MEYLNKFYNYPYKIGTSSFSTLTRIEYNANTDYSLASNSSTDKGSRTCSYNPSKDLIEFLIEKNLLGSFNIFSDNKKQPLPEVLADGCLINKLSCKAADTIFIYEDLGDESTHKRLKLETAGLSGVYLIFNKITKDYYIGSAATGKFYSRFSNHLFNFHGSKIVKHAVKKYKISAFAFIILELFPEVVTKENNKNLLDLEDFYLKSLLPNYNILTEAGSSFGYKHTEITRIKMKSVYSMDRRLRIGNLNKGKSFSGSALFLKKKGETIDLMREKALNREKPIYSDQALANMKKTSKPIKVYNLDYTVYGEYPSIVETAESLDCGIKTVSRALNSPSKMLKRR